MTQEEPRIEEWVCTDDDCPFRTYEGTEKRAHEEMAGHTLRPVYA